MMDSEDFRQRREDRLIIPAHLQLTSEWVPPSELWSVVPGNYPLSYVE